MRRAVQPPNLGPRRQRPHKAEAVFKAFARALRMAVAHIPFDYTVPSSKGVL